VQVWLEQHSDRLDVRSLWLGHLSLSRRVGGDALQLARARDRIFAGCIAVCPSSTTCPASSGSAGVEAMR